MEDLGLWTCKAMMWDEWGEGKVELRQFREAEIEFQSFWGDVYLEAGGNLGKDTLAPQKFSCLLYYMNRF